MRKATTLLVAAGLIGALAGAAHGATGMQITEWMYQGAASSNNEYYEFTNMGPAAIDMTGWAFDDNDALQGRTDLSAFGTVGVGESVILTEIAPDAFRTRWGLSASVKVIGGNTNNLGRSDALNIYNALTGGTLMDSLTYNDQAGQGPRTNGTACDILFENLDATTAGAWSADAAGVNGAWTNASGETGSPGIYYAAPVVPEPSSLAALFGGLLGVVGMIRRRK